MKPHVLAAIALVVFGSLPHIARAATPAEEKALCIDAVTQGQRLRESHKLVQAEAQFRVCARPSCPRVLQHDCGGWVTELVAAVPTVVLSAKAADGATVVDAKVTLDGEPFAASLDGHPLAIDPGPHTFRFVRSDGAATAQEVVVKEAEQGQPIVGVFPHTDAPVLATSGHTQRLAAIALGGAGVVVVGASVVLAFVAKGEDRTAAGEPGLARQADSASAFHEGTTASVLFGAGLAIVGAGVAVWLTAPSDSPKPAVGTNGHELLVRWSF